MNIETLREAIHGAAREYLRPDKSGKGYICPICGDGDGEHGANGITTKDGVHFTCWGGGCFTNADIIDIIGLQFSIGEPLRKIQKACELLGIDPEAAEIRQPVRKEPRAAEEETDYSDFFLQANRDIEKTEYHRGLSLETLNRFKVGYVEKWRHPKAPNAPLSSRLIIPTSRSSYLARDTKGSGEYSKQKVGRTHLFNAGAIATSTRPIYVVEGEIDAMSIEEVGGTAVGLGSHTNYKNLLAYLEEIKPKSKIIIALDNDKDPSVRERVGRSQKALEEGLKNLGIPYEVYNPCGDYKDCNEALCGNREAFTEAVLEPETRYLLPKREALQSVSAYNAIPSLLDLMRESKGAAYIPTGYTQFDKLLGGGLFAGLYIIGAISSLGKTTFVMQMADQIAQQGKKVIIFSLEMARTELMAKSISRLTAIRELNTTGRTTGAKTTRDILLDNFQKEEEPLLKWAVEGYGKYAGNIWIVEGTGNVGVQQIAETVADFKEVYGEAPVVIVDYLQILSPYSERMTDKQNTDKAVLELKRISRENKIPVIGVSSFNRDNYTSPLNLAAFKESGAIEYSSDILIGLQYEGMDYRNKEKDQDRTSRISALIDENGEKARTGKSQSIQVRILKNRNGSKGTVLMDFYPMFNYFQEQQEERWEVVAQTQ